MTRAGYPTELKARTLALIMSGSSVAAAARAAGVKTDTARHWRDEHIGKVIANPTPPVTLSTMIAAYLGQNLKTLTAISERIGDPAYIQDRSVDELIAATHAVGDWTIQILRAITPGSGEDLVLPQPGPEWEEVAEWPPKRDDDPADPLA